MEKVAELLERAADALESGEIAWGKYRGFDCQKPPGTYCAVETLDKVGRQMMPKVEQWPALTSLILAAERATSLHVTKQRDRRHLTAWNDTEARTLGQHVRGAGEDVRRPRLR